MHQIVTRSDVRTGAGAQGAGPDNFRYTHPSQVTDAVLIAVHDFDGTIVKSYDSVRVVLRANEDLPDIFKDVVARGVPDGQGGKAEALDRIERYFAARFAHPKSGESLSRIDNLFLEQGHKNILHRTLETFDRVVEEAIKGLESDGVSITPWQASLIRERAQQLKSTKLEDYTNEANAIYPGFSEYLQRSSDAGVTHAIYTNTEVSLALLRLHDANENGALIDVSKLARIYAKADNGCALLDDAPDMFTHKSRVKWDGTDADFNRQIEWLEENGVDLARFDMARLKQIYMKMQPYKGNKPNAEPIRELIRDFAPSIEKTINAGLNYLGYEGAPFRFSYRNVLMTGESASDMDSTYERPGDRNSLRVARFALQWQGVLQHKEAIEADARIRGAAHLCCADTAISRFGEARVHELYNGSRVLLRGYETFLELMNEAKMVFGYRGTPASQTRQQAQLSPAAVRHLLTAQAGG